MDPYNAQQRGTSERLYLGLPVDTWQVIAAVAGVVGVLIAAVTVIITVSGHSSSPPAVSAISSRSSVAPAPVDTTTPVETTFPGPTPTFTPTDTPTADTGPVLREGDLTINEGYGATLFTDAPDWNIGRGCGGCELWNQSGLTAGVGGQLAVVDTPGLPDYATCLATTNYVSEIKDRDEKRGLRLCVKLGDNHAAIEIVKTSPSDYATPNIVLKVRTWAPPS